MKRILYILLVMALPLALLPGCRNIADPVFDESSSQRVQNLIDEAYDTLTSSQEGWYFSDYLGFGSSSLGGYWFWCKFNKDYTVEAACERMFSYPEDEGTDSTVIPTFTVAKSDFDLIRGRGAVLTYNVFNEVLHSFSEPRSGAPNAEQGDYEFTIVEVTPDLVTVKGIKTGKTMYFYKKTDSKTVGETLNAINDFFNEFSACPAWTPDIKTGAITKAQAEEWAATAPVEADSHRCLKAIPSITRSGRVFTLNYSVDQGMEEMEYETAPGVNEKFQVHKFETKSVSFPFIPSRTEKAIDLITPVTYEGYEISGFTFAYDGELGVLTSNDANQTIKMTQSFPPINKLFPEYSWIADPTTGGSGPSFMAAWNAATERNMALNGETLVPEVWYGSMQATLGNSAVGITFLSELGPDLWGAQYNFTFEAIDETENEISLVFTGNGALDSAYYRNTFQGLIDAYANHSPYYIEANSLTNPTVVVFTSKADSDFYFTCEKL